MRVVILTFIKGLIKTMSKLKEKLNSHYKLLLEKIFSVTKLTLQLIITVI